MKNRNEITGDLIRTKQKRSPEYDDHYDTIFGKRDFRNKKLTKQRNKYQEDPDEWDEERMDIIGKNGPTGLHYLNEEGEGNE